MLTILANLTMLQIIVRYEFLSRVGPDLVRDELGPAIEETPHKEGYKDGHGDHLGDDPDIFEPQTHQNLFMSGLLRND